MKKLRPYQVETVGILARGGINASGLGAGKTVTSVEACRVLDLGRAPRVLVIAPATMPRQWEATFAEQFPALRDRGLLHITGTHRTDTENWGLILKKQPGVFIMSWNAMHGGIPEDIRRKASKGRNRIRKEPKATKASALRAMREGTVPPWSRTGTWDLVILDEAHRACNREGVPRQVLKCIKATQMLALSATPGGGRPEGLWALLNLIWPNLFPNFWQWAEKHFEIEDDSYYSGGQKKSVKKIGKEKFPGAVWRGIPAVVRYRTEEVVADMPPIVERQVVVSMGEEQAEQYADFKKQSLAWINDMPVGASLPIEQRTRLRQAALGTLLATEVEGKYKPDISYNPDMPQPKIDAVLEILRDLPPDEPVLLWTSSAKWARMAEQAIGSQAVSWTMKTTAAKRKKIETGFGKEWRVLIAQTQSLAEGVDWIKDVCRCEIIASATEDTVANQQAEGRLYRPGQKSPVQRWRLLTEGTIDFDVELNNLTKRSRMSSLYGDK